MKEFLQYLICLLVDYPQEVIVEEINLNDNSYTYKLKTNKNDIGKIIGKEGKIIAAIRNTAKIMAIKKGIHVRIEINEE